MKCLVISLFLLFIAKLPGSEFMIRSLTLDDWDNFRDLRLRALLENPKAYGIAVADEGVRSDEEWKAFCQDGTDKWYVVAEYQGKLIGMLGAVQLFGSYMNHQVEIVGAYVDPAFRQRGIMKQLFQTLKTRLQEVSHLEQMITWVTLHETQTSKHMFEKFGFKFAGVLSKTVKFGNKYYDCCWLEASLRP